MGSCGEGGPDRSYQGGAVMSNDCCMRAHMTATPPWSCACACHTKTEEESVVEPPMDLRPLLEAYRAAHPDCQAQHVVTERGTETTGGDR